MKINRTNRLMKIYNTGMDSKMKQNNKKVGKDKLNFSDKAKDFQIAKNKLKDIPDMRMDKVENLKNKIKSGTYEVKGKDIGGKIYQSLSFDKKV